MGKKKTQGGGKHQTQSFQQLVGQANRDALKPYVEQLVVAHVSNLGNQIAARMFTQLGNIQTRIIALERVLQQKLGLTNEELANLVLDIEDEATGYSKVDRAAQAGDFLRIELATKTSTETEFSRNVKREVASLGSDSDKNPDTKTMNDALVGMKAGETKEIMVGAVAVRLTVNRVSEAPKAPEAPAQEG